MPGPGIVIVRDREAVSPALYGRLVEAIDGVVAAAGLGGIELVDSSPVPPTCGAPPMPSPETYDPSRSTPPPADPGHEGNPMPIQPDPAGQPQPAPAPRPEPAPDDTTADFEPAEDAEAEAD
jgi:hypothetical protein